jgi:uncharacterized membrane protein YdjX (TVP38/TMEM64 family)
VARENTRSLVKLALFAGVLLSVAVALRVTPAREYLTAEALAGLLERARGAAWLPIAYVAAYVIAVVLALPSIVLTLAGGAVFGFVPAVLLTTLSANLGANAAFWVARSLGREGVQRLLGNRLRGIDEQASANGFYGILFLRLILIAPYNLLNIAAGLSAVRWRDYAAGTLLGMLPMIAVYTFFAESLVSDVTGGDEAARGRLWIAAALVGLLILTPITVRFLLKRRAARREAKAVPHDLA